MIATPLQLIDLIKRSPAGVTLRGITKAAKLSAADELTLAKNFRAAFAMLSRAEQIRTGWQHAEDCLMTEALELRYWYVEADL